MPNGYGFTLRIARLVVSVLLVQQLVSEGSVIAAAGDRIIRRETLFLDPKTTL